MSDSSATPPAIFSDEDRVSSSSSPNSIPLTPDDISRWQCHMDLQDFGESLHAAAKAVFPNTSKSRYKKVSVLLLSWEDEDPKLPVSLEIEQLDNVFKNLYGFETETWKIPNQNCHGMLNRKILDFVMTEDDPADHLFIVYYGGHAKLTKDRLLSWTSWRNNQNSKCPTVQWSGIQNALEQAASDVLILLDCCYAGTANASDGNGVTELISACPFNAAANPVGSFSFTKQLMIELRDLSQRPSFTIAELYRNIFCRIQGRIPEDPCERHPAPIHFALTQDDPHFPRSIQLSVRPEHINKRNAARNLASEPPITGRGSAVSILLDGKPILDPSSDFFPEAFSATSTSNLSDQVPRMLLAIRLNETLRPGELSHNLFKEWLRMMPTVAEEVKVEAGFGSYSLILIVSIPITVSLYLPEDPAIIRIGPITSSNIIEQAPKSGEDQKILSKSSIQNLKTTDAESLAHKFKSEDLPAQSFFYKDVSRLLDVFPKFAPSFADSAYASSSAPTDRGGSDIVSRKTDSAFHSEAESFADEVDRPEFVTVLKPGDPDRQAPLTCSYSDEYENYISESVLRRLNLPLRTDGKVNLVLLKKNSGKSDFRRFTVRPDRDSDIEADIVLGIPDRKKNSALGVPPREHAISKSDTQPDENDIAIALGLAFQDQAQNPNLTNEELRRLGINIATALEHMKPVS